MIVLDTDVLVEYARPNTDPVVLSYLAERADRQWIVPAVAMYEYLTYFDSQSRRRKEHSQIDAG